jgi:hypothetical protein
MATLRLYLSTIDAAVWLWVLAASGALVAAYLGYLGAAAIHRRQRRGPAGLVRVAGRVTGASQAELVLDGGGFVIALPLALARRAPRPGRFVTVDGVPRLRARERSGYREAARGVEIDALRVTVGRWPEPRWLRVPVAIASLALLLALSQLLFPPAPSGRLFAHTRAAGAERLSR